MSSLVRSLNVHEVAEHMYDMMKQSGLDSKDVKLMRCVPMTVPPQGLTTLPGAGFTIPYLTQDGKPTKFFRYRYIKSPVTFGKPLRYVQPANLLPTVYWAPQVPWRKVLDAKDEPLFITEGEKKAACGCKHGFATLGLGGVWSFKSGVVELIKELAEIEWAQRRVYIVYDSDAISNPGVMLAENRLANELLSRKASVYTIRLPEGDTGKVGMDDYIVAEGRDAFQKLVDEDSEEFVNSRALHAMNEIVTFIKHPHAVWSNEKRRLINQTSFVAGTHAPYSHTVLEPTQKPGEFKAVVKRTAKEWVNWKGRAEADTLVYEPGQEARVDDSLNLWRGWGCEPKAGNLKPWYKLFNFIMLGASPEGKKWFEQWLAYPIQNPGAKMFSAVVIWGVAQGTGKTFIAHIMQKIYGENFGEVTNDDLNGSFNTWAVNKQFILGEEIAGGENKRVLSDRLKKLITQPDILVNTKFIAQYTIRDCVNFYFTSNHPDAFYLEDSDRRFFVHEVRSNPMSREDYAEIDAWKDGEGPAALLHHLLSVDLTDFHSKSAPPVTKSKEDMRQESKSEVQRWVMLLRENPEGVLVAAGAPTKWTLATGSDLYRVYDPEGRRNQLLTMSHELRKARIPRANGGDPVNINGQSHRIWIVANGPAREKLEAMKPAQLAELYNKEHGDGSRKF